MTNPTDKPQLHFFRSTPNDLLERPPLASSLQSFESCLFFIALQRYPHALAACTFSVESAVKSALRTPPEKRDPLQELLQVARVRFPPLASFPEADLVRLRLTRNRIVHYGFSPKDDRESATLLLNSGFPFLRLCYESLFGFSLEEGVLTEFGDHLRVASAVFQKIKSQPELDPRYCLLPLAHQVRWSVRESLMSHWEAESVKDAEESGATWAAVERRRRQTERRFKLSWAFDCPVCRGIDTFVCELAEDDLERRNIRLLRAACADCELVVHRDCPFLADALCREQVLREQGDILREHGLS